jgi:hypothetical protein
MYSKKCITECEYRLTNLQGEEASAWWNKDGGEAEGPPICYYDWKSTDECPGYKEK